MERLPKKYEVFLKEIGELDQQAHGLKLRLATITKEQALDESFMLEDSENRGFIRVTKKSDGKTLGTKPFAPQDGPSLIELDNRIVNREFTYPHDYYLLARGQVYFSEVNRERLNWLITTVVAAIIAVVVGIIFTVLQIELPLLISDAGSLPLQHIKSQFFFWPHN